MSDMAGGRSRSYSSSLGSEFAKDYAGVMNQIPVSSVDQNHILIYVGRLSMKTNKDEGINLGDKIEMMIKHAKNLLKSRTHTSTDDMTMNTAHSTSTFEFPLLISVLKAIQGLVTEKGSQTFPSTLEMSQINPLMSPRGRTLERISKSSSVTPGISTKCSGNSASSERVESIDSTVRDS
jgi:hypothetical protein